MFCILTLSYLLHNVADFLLRFGPKLGGLRVAALLDVCQDFFLDVVQMRWEPNGDFFLEWSRTESRRQSPNISQALVLFRGHTAHVGVVVLLSTCFLATGRFSSAVLKQITAVTCIVVLCRIQNSTREINFFHFFDGLYLCFHQSFQVNDLPSHFGHFSRSLHEVFVLLQNSILQTTLERLLLLLHEPTPRSRIEFVLSLEVVIDPSFRRKCLFSKFLEDVFRRYLFHFNLVLILARNSFSLSRRLVLAIFANT
mmetsp:Transcript_23448/g.65085  ORF Transcript_23448/g.65085 Transcript_23448/m.65085 type:complete len:254 (-) Transcript_23448:7430-8191(-)